MKKILITGAGSYIGTSFEEYMKQWPDEYQVDTLDMIGDGWKKYDFSGYDAVYHVAGIAHSDNGKISREKAKLYYEVNTKLTVSTAMKAKASGVKQFIFMSSAIVYGESAPIGKSKMITSDTPVSPANCYGDSKVRAEKGLRKLEDETFRVVILRPPMIYGKGSKGNYPLMSKIAQKLPIFPYVKNCRSMLYIENLMEFVKLMIDNEETGTFWPQNKEYSNTSELVRTIARVHGKHLLLIPGTAWMLKILGMFTDIVDKAFGNLSYSQELSRYHTEYRICDLSASIERTENPDSRIKKQEHSMEQKPEQIMNREKYLNAEVYPGFTTGELQEKLYETLAYFMKICRENNLYYWCGGGTMLGAVRHQGFIPWDDDIDVFMPRKDYEKLVEIWDQKADTSRFALCRTDRTHNYHLTILRVVNVNTTFINRHSINEDLAHGVSIDVNPFDGVPNSKILRAIQIYHAVMFSVFNVQRLPDHQGKLLRLATGILLNSVKDPEKRYRIWKRHEKAMSKYDFYTSRDVKELVTSFKGLFRPYPRSYFNRKKATFEDLTVPIPVAYDEYMKQIYGDYMALPPESERKGKHNIAFMDLTKSYKSYRGIQYCIGDEVATNAEITEPTADECAEGGTAE